MNYPIFDGHADTPLELYVAGDPALTSAKGHVTLEDMKTVPNYAQFFAFCPACVRHRYDPRELYTASLRAFLEEISVHGDVLSLCGNNAQREKAWQEGKTAAFLSMEGAECISCDVGLLEEAAACGVRMTTLTWNFENELAGSHTTGGGLTAKGKDFVRRAQSLGIVIDVSHLSDRAFYDICDITQYPIIASHSNSRTLCGMSRNLTDEQFRLIAQSGGTVGLNLYTCFLTGEETATYEDVRRHLAHFLDLGGEDAVALGGDLDGIAFAPHGFTGVRDYATMLESFGITPSVTEKLSYENLSKVLDRCKCKPV